MKGQFSGSDIKQLFESFNGNVELEPITVSKAQELPFDVQNIDFSVLQPRNWFNAA